MTRRIACRHLALIPVLVYGAPDDGMSLRGKLVEGPGGKAAIQSGGKTVILTGDEDTVGVLKDKRLADVDFEVIGKFSPAGEFAVNPIHKRAMFVHKDGKRLLITYWCDVCAIRTYTPGICWCCREDTALDLREPDTVDKK